jgi:hypothetical protein
MADTGLVPIASPDKSLGRTPRGQFISRHVDLPLGREFGRLTVLGDERPAGKKYQVTCQCDCGRVVRCDVDALKRGQKLQCGDHPRVLTDDQVRALAARMRTHGMSRTPEYSAWVGMKMRCYNAENDRFSDYGGRGIAVCERWLDSFVDFLTDMGNRPGRGYSLDRIDVNGDYEPANCRWADASSQTRNRRPFVIRPGLRDAGEQSLSPPYIPPPAPSEAAHRNTRHGMVGSSEYRAWRAMKQRCHNPDHRAYRNYGARGVRVCAEWLDSFDSFIRHVGMRPPGGYSIDRIDNTRGYEPGNVRWADAKTQNRNRRAFVMVSGSRSL